MQQGASRINADKRIIFSGIRKTRRIKAQWRNPPSPRLRWSKGTMAGSEWVFKIATPSSVGLAMTVKLWQFQFGSETELTKFRGHCEE
jgi:hypothetical protein